MCAEYFTDRRRDFLTFDIHLMIYHYSAGPERLSKHGGKQMPKNTRQMNFTPTAIRLLIQLHIYSKELTILDLFLRMSFARNTVRHSNMVGGFGTRCLFQFGNRLGTNFQGPMAKHEYQHKEFDQFPKCATL